MTVGLPRLLFRDIQRWLYSTVAIQEARDCCGQARHHRQRRVITGSGIFAGDRPIKLYSRRPKAARQLHRRLPLARSSSALSRRCEPPFVLLLVASPPVRPTLRPIAEQWPISAERFLPRIESPWILRVMSAHPAGYNLRGLRPHEDAPILMTRKV